MLPQLHMSRVRGMERLSEVSVVPGAADYTGITIITPWPIHPPSCK